MPAPGFWADERRDIPETTLRLHALLDRRRGRAPDRRTAGSPSRRGTSSRPSSPRPRRARPQRGWPPPSSDALADRHGQGRRRGRRRRRGRGRGRAGRRRGRGPADVRAARRAAARSCRPGTSASATTSARSAATPPRATSTPSPPTPRSRCASRPWPPRARCASAAAPTSCSSAHAAGGGADRRRHAPAAGAQGRARLRHDDHVERRATPTATRSRTSSRSPRTAARRGSRSATPRPARSLTVKALARPRRDRRPRARRRRPTAGTRPRTDSGPFSDRRPALRRQDRLQRLGLSAPSGPPTIDGSGATKISDRGRHPRWSPDGTRLAWDYGGPLHGQRRRQRRPQDHHRQALLGAAVGRRGHAAVQARERLPHGQPARRDGERRRDRLGSTSASKFAVLCDISADGAKVLGRARPLRGLLVDVHAPPATRPPRCAP